MTSAIAGKSASVANSGATEVKNVNIDDELDLGDATSYDSSGNKEYIALLAGVTGSATAIGTKPTTGTKSSFQVDSGGNTWTGTAIIGRVGTGIPVDGVVEHPFDFTFTGEVTKT